MIKNIVFDLGGVLLKNKAQSILDKFDIDESDKELIVNDFFDNCDEIDLGNISIKEKFDNSKLPINVKERYEEIIINYYKYRDIDMKLINLIKLLKNNNYKIYILSDNNKEAYDYYRKMPIFANIDGWVISCEYKTMKRNKKIFNILFDKYGLKPEECYYIDDKNENTEIGNSFGMKGFVFDKNVGELMENMKKNGILL